MILDPSTEKECDFIVKNGQEFIAIQATFTLNDSNREREINGLKFAIEKLNLKQGYIITFDQEERVAANINIVPFWRFFFDSTQF